MSNRREIPVAIGGLPSEKLEVDDLQVQISSLQEMLNMRRQSQEEVRNLLNDQVSISRATPKGVADPGLDHIGISVCVSHRLPDCGRFTRGLILQANTGTPIYATADGVGLHGGLFSELRQNSCRSTTATATGRFSLTIQRFWSRAVNASSAAI